MELPLTNWERLGGREVSKQRSRGCFVYTGFCIYEVPIKHTQEDGQAFEHRCLEFKGEGPSWR